MAKNPQFAVGDLVTLDQDDGKIRKVTAVATVYRDMFGHFEQIVQAAPVGWTVSGSEYGMWRSASRFAPAPEQKPMYTINTTSGMYLRALDRGGAVIASIQRRETDDDGRRIRLLHMTATSLGYQLADPE